MAEASTTNPEILISFLVSPASILKKAGSVLHDFGIQGFGRLDITEKGFEVTVRDALSDSGAAYHLFLPSSKLINFHCSKPIVNEFIEVSRLHRLTTNPNHTDNDTVTIFHAKEAEYLTLVYGRDPGKEYKLDFLQIDDIAKFPDTTFFSEAVLPSEILTQLTERLEGHETSELVAVEIKAERATVYIDYIKDVGPWTVEYGSGREEAETRIIEPGGSEEAETRIIEQGGSDEAETRIIEPGQAPHAWFKLRNLKVMNKASFLGKSFAMCLCSEPANNVVMRFDVQGVGELAFLYKAETIHPDYVKTAVFLKLLLFSPLLNK